jgi:hypothetical protein
MSSSEGWEEVPRPRQGYDLGAIRRAEFRQEMLHQSGPGCPRFQAEEEWPFLIWGLGSGVQRSIDTCRLTKT